MSRSFASVPQVAEEIRKPHLGEQWKNSSDVARSDVGGLDGQHQLVLVVEGVGRIGHQLAVRSSHMFRQTHVTPLPLPPSHSSQQPPPPGFKHVHFLSASVATFC